MKDAKSINREELLQAITCVKPALAAQDYVPSLTHIKFDGETAQTYNDISSIAVQCDLDLDVCLPGDLLLKTLSSMQAEEIIAVKNEDTSVTIAAGRSKIKLPSLPHSDFPFKLPKTKSLGKILVNQKILEGLNHCMVSIGTDPTHPEQMGITLEIDADSFLSLYSTDNFTISKFITGCQAELLGTNSVILPTFFCQHLLSLAKVYKDSKKITIDVRADSLIATLDDKAEIFTKLLVDAESLDFQKIISRNLKKNDLEELSKPIPDVLDSACKRALLILQNETDKVTKVSVSGGRFKMYSESSLGQAEDSMTLKSYDCSFHMDPFLVTRALGQCSKIALLERAMVLSNSDESFIHLIAHCSA